MVRTLKEATVERFHDDTVADLEAHLRVAVAAHNLARRLKGPDVAHSLQTICDLWKKDPSFFKAHPHHLIAGPYT